MPEPNDVNNLANKMTTQLLAELMEFRESIAELRANFEPGSEDDKFCVDALRRAEDDPAKLPEVSDSLLRRLDPIGEGIEPEEIAGPGPDKEQISQIQAVQSAMHDAEMNGDEAGADRDDDARMEVDDDAEFEYEDRMGIFKGKGKLDEQDPLKNLEYQAEHLNRLHNAARSLQSLQQVGSPLWQQIQDIVDNIHRNPRTWEESAKRLENALEVRLLGETIDTEGELLERLRSVVVVLRDLTDLGRDEKIGNFQLRAFEDPMILWDVVTKLEEMAFFIVRYVWKPESKEDEPEDGDEEDPSSKTTDKLDNIDIEIKSKNPQFDNSKDESDGRKQLSPAPKTTDKLDDLDTKIRDTWKSLFAKRIPETRSKSNRLLRHAQRLRKLLASLSSSSNTGRDELNGRILYLSELAHEAMTFALSPTASTERWNELFQLLPRWESAAGSFFDSGTRKPEEIGAYKCVIALFEACMDLISTGQDVYSMYKDHQAEMARVQREKEEEKKKNEEKWARLKAMVDEKMSKKKKEEEEKEKARWREHIEEYAQKERERQIMIREALEKSLQGPGKPDRPARPDGPDDFKP